MKAMVEKALVYPVVSSTGGSKGEGSSNRDQYQMPMCPLKSRISIKFARRGRRRQVVNHMIRMPRASQTREVNLANQTTMETNSAVQTREVNLANQTTAEEVNLEVSLENQTTMEGNSANQPERREEGVKPNPIIKMLPPCYQKCFHCGLSDLPSFWKRRVETSFNFLTIHQ